MLHPSPLLSLLAGLVIEASLLILTPSVEILDPIIASPEWFWGLLVVFIMGLVD